MLKTKLYKTKAVQVEDYTTIELAYLLLDVLKEITIRKKAVPKLLDNANQKTYSFTHEVELMDFKNNKEKLDKFNELQEHLQTRRLAKREFIVVDEVLDGIDSERIISWLGQKIKNKQKYFHLDDNEKVMSPKSWKEFYENHIKIFS